MRGEPELEITCDGDCCMDSFFVHLTSLGRGYDECNVDAEIKANGWTVFEGKDYCPDCWEQISSEKIKKGGV